MARLDDAKISVPMSKAWQIVTTTFLSIFLAELGDKTQLSTLAIAAESNHSWEVFLGAGTALVLTTLIGVLAGKSLAKIVSPEQLDTWSGLCFLSLAIGLVWEVLT